MIYKLRQLQAGRIKFREVEQRWPTCDDALAQLVPALKTYDPAAVMKALHVLLLDWNGRYYKSHPNDAQYRKRFIRVLELYKQKILSRGQTEIEGYSPADDDVLVLFTRFAEVLGPVGASKALHLLAPRFFTMWDDMIARCNSLLTSRAWKHYCSLMQIRQKQCANIGQQLPERLKMIDELEYVLFTKRLITTDPNWVESLGLSSRVG